MGTISVSLPSDGTTAEAANYNTPITTIVGAINGGLDNANIAPAAAISTSKLASDNWLAAWTSWTPSWTNFTVGNGTLNYAKYLQVGKTIYLRLRFTLGSTSAVSGAVSFSLPVNFNADFAGDQDGLISEARIRDTGTAYFWGKLVYASASTAEIRVLNAGSTYLGESTLSSTVPMTWANTDVIFVAGIYEAA